MHFFSNKTSASSHYFCFSLEIHPMKSERRSIEPTSSRTYTRKRNLSRAGHQKPSECKQGKVAQNYLYLFSLSSFSFELSSIKDQLHSSIRCSSSTIRVSCASNPMDVAPLIVENSNVLCLRFSNSKKSRTVSLCFGKRFIQNTKNRANIRVLVQLMAIKTI